MKRIVMLALLALALPVAAFAGSVDFSNTGGTLAGSSAGLTLTGSALTGVSGLGTGLCSTAASCGSVSFTTGALMPGGSLMTGGTFAAGGTFTIKGNGTAGLPNGVIFSGSFSSPVTWVENTSCGPNGAVCYTLSGTISGTWYNGTTVNGVTTQITVAASKNGFNGSATLGIGSTEINTAVPEPGTLGLLGTGLVGLAALLRKKLIA